MFMRLFVSEGDAPWIDCIGHRRTVHTARSAATARISLICERRAPISRGLGMLPRAIGEYMFEGAWSWSS